jgi:hypothetical protein
MGLDGHHLGLDPVLEFPVDVFQVGRLSAPARAIVDDLDLDQLVLEVDERHFFAFRNRGRAAIRPWGLPRLKVFPAQRFKQSLQMFDRLGDLHPEKTQRNVISENGNQKELR